MATKPEEQPTEATTIVHVSEPMGQIMMGLIAAVSREAEEPKCGPVISLGISGDTRRSRIGRYAIGAGPTSTGTMTHGISECSGDGEPPGGPANEPET